MTEATAPTPPAPPAPTPTPTPPAPPAKESAPKDVTTASSSNVQPGVNLESGEREDDVADTAKRDEAVNGLAEQYDDPEQRQRVLDRFDMTEDGS